MDLLLNFKSIKKLRQTRNIAHPSEMLEVTAACTIEGESADLPP